MVSKRSQYAMEYLLVVVFSMLLIIPIVGLLLNSYSDMSYTLSTHQAYSVVEKLSDSALSVYYLGEGSMMKVSVLIPEGVIDAYIENNEILFKIRASGDSYSDMYAFSKIDVIGELPVTPGNHQIIVESRGDHVWIGT